MLRNKFLDLNKKAKGLTPSEEKSLVSAFPGKTPDAYGDLFRYFAGVKKQAQVLNWILTGEVKIESFGSGSQVIELKSKDGRCHKVELW